MILGLGVDLAEVRRIRDAVERHGDRFVRRIYTEAEIAYVERKANRFERYAKGGDNSDLKDWAGKTLPALKHHLDMAEELGKAPSVGQTK